MGVIALSSEIWGNFLCSKYRTTGGSGEVGDWNQQVWVTESQSPEGQKKETNNSFFFLWLHVLDLKLNFILNILVTTGNN